MLWRVSHGPPAATRPSTEARKEPGVIDVKKQRGGRVKEGALQSITRVPHWRPGQWIIVPGGKVKKIRTISTHIGEGHVGACVWYANCEDGTRLEVKKIVREATEHEVNAWLFKLQ
jgi:hypothetical protein